MSKPVRCFDKHAPQLAQSLRLLENVQTHFRLRRVKSPTLVCKLSNQTLSVCIGDSSTSTRRSRQHGIVRVNERYGKDDILRCWVGRDVLERGIHEVVRTQGIPIDAVIKVRDGKVFSSRETAEQPLCVELRSVSNRQKSLILPFTRAQADAQVNLRFLKFHALSMVREIRHKDSHGELTSHHGPGTSPARNPHRHGLWQLPF